ncbi:helix-turn-helix domain-containing protein [Butyricicoccus faecihominis]|uniref:helix-turn-helix domain-containing protein n=1 Tax=Butyricicoccus faecihominis TaxID=1712515 RepID=UPI002479DA8B|nr:helix-turn-helix transcriptional regulator [Butyricicoccus faecihominis]MCQ5130768.1 helix-turn-helix domain-containing protein [Butyricicoccus faecihominis]
MAIGELLQELRKDIGLTQKEVADKMNLTSAAIGAYETNINEPSIASIKFFAQLYNVSTDYLLEMTAIQTPWSKVVSKTDDAAMDAAYESLLNDLLQLSAEDREFIAKIIHALAHMKE